MVWCWIRGVITIVGDHLDEIEERTVIPELLRGPCSLLTTYFYLQNSSHFKLPRNSALLISHYHPVFICTTCVKVGVAAAEISVRRPMPLLGIH